MKSSIQIFLALTIFVSEMLATANADTSKSPFLSSSSALPFLHGPSRLKLKRAMYAMGLRSDIGDGWKELYKIPGKRKQPMVQKGSQSLGISEAEWPGTKSREMSRKKTASTTIQDGRHSEVGKVERWPKARSNTEVAAMLKSTPHRESYKVSSRNVMDKTLPDWTVNLDQTPSVPHKIHSKQFLIMLKGELHRLLSLLEKAEEGATEFIRDTVNKLDGKQNVKDDSQFDESDKSTEMNKRGNSANKDLGERSWHR